MVFTATEDAVFLMNLFDDRPQDYGDLVALEPLSPFRSGQAAADACSEAYELMRRSDEFMVGYVERIATDSP